MMLKAIELKKIYGNVTVLDIPELSIPEGQSFGLVGNNGAGKTTFFRLILDLIRADKGRVEIMDKNVAGSEHWKEYTGSYLDKGFLIDFLSPEEFFEFTGKIKGLSKDDLDGFLKNFEEFFNGEILGKKKYIRDLSMGNRQKTGIAAAIMGDTKLLVLDEPFNGLDPSTQIRLKKTLKELNGQKNITMLISSHDLNHVTEVCDRIVVLSEGKVIHDIIKTEDTLKQLEDYFAV